MKALFTLTIGPVKSFVENGHKMRDLYAGSSILSDLTSRTINELEKHNDIEVVFPPKAQCKHQFGETNVPNRLVVKIKDYNEEKYQNLGEDLIHHIKKEFKKICQQSLGKVSGEVDLKLACNQLKQFLEIYWLIEPYSDTDDDKYGDAYSRMIAKMNAIKGIRPFQQTAEPEGRKCMLHSEYNGIFVKDIKGEKLPFNTNDKHIIRLQNEGKFKFDIKNKEALSAIAFVKRMYLGENSKFESVRDMVFENTLTLKTGDATYFEREIRNNEIFQDEGMKDLGTNVTHLTNAIYDIWDGDINYDDPNREFEYPKEIRDVAIGLRGDLKNRYLELKKFKLQQYYAIIKFDGDGMGTKYGELKDEEIHKVLSDEICEFAKCARKIINLAGGICIYAGGEDVLAVVTLQNGNYSAQK